MCAPLRIPLPVTILYVVTVTNLVVLLNLTLVDANVRVLNRFNQTIVDSIMDLPAKFGAPVPDEGIWGHLIYAEPRDACSEIKPPPKVTSNQSGIPNKWIALVKRSNCNFDWKVIQAQKQGYIAVIIHNVGSDQLVPMRGSGNQSKVVIPSIFIGYQDAEYLYEKCNDDIHYTIVIDTESPIIDPNTAKLIFSIFGIVIGSCFLTMIVFAVVKWVRDYRRRSRSRLSKANLKQLPVQKFKKGDVYDICAICLDEYEEGEKLRILPCNHAYHMKCIDPWLLKNKKTCPICKRKVMPSRNHSDSESDSDDDTDNEGTSESEPLLSANRFPSTRGNTFNNTGVPDRLLQHYNFSSSDDEEEVSSTEDSLRPLSSRYQSSVEVHSEPDYRTARAMRPPRRIGDLSARYAMFSGNTSEEGDNPAKTANQDEEEADASGAQASTSEKPETKPKEKRAWEYGLSPPKPDHFSIYNETTKEDIAEEEEPVAIEMSPNGSQEEEEEGNNMSSGGRKGAEGGVVVVRKGNAKGKKAAGLSGEKKPSGTIPGPRGSSQGHDNGNARGCADGTAETGSKRQKMMKNRGSPEVSGSEQQNGSLQKTGKRVATTGGVISPMEGRNSNSRDIGKNVEDLNGASHNGGLSNEDGRGMDGGNSNSGEVDHVQRLQTDENNLELQGAVGGAEEDSCLLEQPTVEVVSSGRRKNKKKLPKKKR